MAPIYISEKASIGKLTEDAKIVAMYKFSIPIVALLVAGAGVFFIYYRIQNQTSLIPQLDDKYCSSLPVTSRVAGVAPTGTIDASSLIAKTSSPTITGTFTNAGALEVVIWRGKLVLPATPPGDFEPQPFWQDSTDHGGQVVACGGASGRYSSEVWVPLQEGDYTVGVYTHDLIYTAAGFQGYTPAILLATGILQVTPQ